MSVPNGTDDNTLAHTLRAGGYAAPLYTAQDTDLVGAPHRPVDDTPAGWAAYNSGYTAEFPPAPQTLTQHLAFWRTVDIPDAFCARAVKERDTRLRNLAYQAVHDEFREAVREDQERWKSTRAQAEKVAELVVDQEIRRARSEEGRYQPIPRTELRDLIRAAAIVVYGTDLPDPDERAAVGQVPVRLGAQVMTAAEAYGQYECADWFWLVAGATSDVLR